MEKQHHCSFCGTEVGPQEYEGIGAGRLYCCPDPTCEREFVEEQRAAQEQAALDALDDGYARYL